jgi:NAD(P)-dependent dehydrogenase (short-subunit alcohol dehydrogenase family)
MQPRKSGPSQVVVITGASAGVGRATARRFARDGADVAVLARGRAGLEAVRAEIEAMGRRALVVPVDVANASAVDEAADTVERELGPIDVWVNGAMATVFGEFEQITADEFQRVTEVTYLGFVNGTRAALRVMRPRDHGVIVQVGSALAYRGIPLQSPYCGAKHAIQGFTESVRAELMHQKSHIWITMVQMPALNTPQFEWGRNKMGQRSQPVPPIFQPEVAAEGVHFASRARRREVNVGLSTSVVIAGNKLLPGFGDWYLARTGYRSQLRGGVPAALDNLFEPRDDTRDFGAHGPCDEAAHASSAALWASEHRGMVAGFAGLAALAIASAFAFLRSA